MSHLLFQKEHAVWLSGNVSVNSKRYHPTPPPGIRPKLVPGPPEFDLIKCPGGAAFDRGGEVAKKSMKEGYYYLQSQTHCQCL